MNCIEESLQGDHMDTLLPILYSFRRCPYAMRARWALLEAGDIGVSAIQKSTYPLSRRDN